MEVAASTNETSTILTHSGNGAAIDGVKAAAAPKQSSLLKQLAAIADDQNVNCCLVFAGIFAFVAMFFWSILAIGYFAEVRGGRCNNQTCKGLDVVRPMTLNITDSFQVSCCKKLPDERCEEYQYPCMKFKVVATLPKHDYCEFWMEDVPFGNLTSLMADPDFRLLKEPGTQACFNKFSKTAESFWKPIKALINIGLGSMALSIFCTLLAGGRFCYLYSKEKEE